MNQIMTFLPLILIFLVMYFLLIRPQKKREKQVQTMRNALTVGDEIITIGGICGKIVKVKEESIVIQVGADKVKFEMMRWAVSKVVTPAARPQVTEVVEEDSEEAVAAKPKKMKKAAPKADVEEPAEEAPAKKRTSKKDVDAE